MTMKLQMGMEAAFVCRRVLGFDMDVAESSECWRLRGRQDMRQELEAQSASDNRIGDVTAILYRSRIYAYTSDRVRALYGCLTLSCEANCCCLFVYIESGV